MVATPNLFSNSFLFWFTVSSRFRLRQRCTRIHV